MALSSHGSDLQYQAVNISFSGSRLEYNKKQLIISLNICATFCTWTYLGMLVSIVAHKIHNWVTLLMTFLSKELIQHFPVL